MNYRTEIEIARPRERVADLYADPDHLTKWLPGLESFTRIDGDTGKPGAKSRLVFRMGTKAVEMIETIMENELPDMMARKYEGPGIRNEVVTRFSEAGPDRTVVTAESEFHFKGVMMKLTGLLMPGCFRKRTDEFLESFRKFAESGGPGER